jgi:hypothetical protein
VRSSSRFLKILLLCVLILSGGLFSGCAGMGGPGGSAIGNIFNPVNQESDQKNTGGSDNNAGDLGDPTINGDNTVATNNGSPGQPTQPGAGKPHPPGGGDPESPLPLPGGTVATTNSPAQPSQAGVGRCQDYIFSGSFSVQGRVRPPSLQDAECVEFSSPPVVTVWGKYSAGAPWTQLQVPSSLPVNACGAFDTTITFYCNKPDSIKIKADYGYQGTLYEAWSDEMPLVSTSNPPPLNLPDDSGDEGILDEGPRGNHLPGPWDNGGLHNPTYIP